MSGELSYRIVIKSGERGPGPATFRPNQRGECYINLYESLDFSRSPSIEHTQKVGCFEIKGIDEMSAIEFLDKIREGIAERTDS